MPFNILRPKSVCCASSQNPERSEGILCASDQAQATTPQLGQNLGDKQSQQGLVFAIEIYLAIFSFLSPHYITRVACTCKLFAQMCDDNWLWRSLLVKKFGEDSLNWCSQLDPPLPYKEIYKERIILCIPADKLDIIWLTSTHNYWKLANTEAHETAAGKAAVLHSVCWFDVQEQLVDVPVGKYHVIWRLLVEPASTGLHQLEFKAHTEKKSRIAANCTVVETTFNKPVNNVQKLQGKGWVEYELPGVLNVQPKLEFLEQFKKETFGATVKFSIIRHTNDWKTGLRLDCVRLQRVG
ncbi:hypothetical protein B0H14DRAFT_2745138 [Mycena olivaceomarginata]|nr:hypothetical protein B0H14DRAFT_2745138 [Mycena olivaceomarginata]